MAEDVQKLLLQVDATTTLLRQELAKARNDVDKFADHAQRRSSDVSNSIAFMGGAMKGMLGIFSVGALASFSRSILNFADDLGTAAEQAGISVQRFQTLREGLRSLEVGAEQQQKIFQKLLTTLGDVQGGTAAKGTMEVLDRMGIASRILNGEITSTDGLLDAVAQAAGRYTTQAQFAADVSTLVGQKMGPQLAAALADGGIALKTAEDNFRNTGAVIDEQLVKKLADANESIDAFATQSKNRLTIWAGETLTILQRLGVAFDNITGRQDTSTRSGAITAYMQAREKRQSLEAGTFGFLPVAPQAIANARAQELRLQKLLRQQEMQNPALTDPMSRLFPLNANGTFGTPPKIARKVTPEKTKTKASARTSKENDFIEPSMRSGWALEMQQEGNASFELQNQALQSMADTLKELQTQDFSVEVIGREQLRFAEDYTRALTEGLAASIVYGEKLGDVLKNIGRSILATGINALIESAIGQTSRNLFGGLFGGATGFGGFRANGGPVSPGKAYVVGEKRPELFVPSTAGTIVPSVPNGNGNGGGTTRVVVEPSPLFAVTLIEGATQVARSEVANGIAKANRPRMTAAMGV